VTVRHFKQAGVKLANCGGDAGRPVVFRRVRVASETGEADAGLVLFANPTVAQPAANENVTFRDCRLEGPFKIAVDVDGPVRDVGIVASRIWNASEGVRCREIRTGTAVNLTLAGNTFADVGDAVVAANAPDDRRSKLDLRQNLFTTCRTALKVEAGDATAFVAADRNARDAGTKDGRLPNPAAEHDVAFVSSNPTRPGFLAYPKDHPLARGGQDGTPIGVPAD
jgi:hypothetical protein